MMLNARFHAWLEPFGARLGVMVGLWALMGAVVAVALCVASPQAKAPEPAIAATAAPHDRGAS